MLQPHVLTIRPGGGGGVGGCLRSCWDINPWFNNITYLFDDKTGRFCGFFYERCLTCFLIDI